MTTLNVNLNRHQTGSSLVELMIASLIGLIAIGIIGSVFLSGQKVAKEKSLELLLLQGLNITLQVMKEDIQRAGYDGRHGSSLKLLGAANIMQVSGASEIGFVYFRDGSRLSENYRSVKYKLNGDALQVCEKGTVSKSDILPLSGIGMCRSLLDDSLIQVTRFDVAIKPLMVGSTTSSYTDVTIEAQTVDGSYTKVATISIKQRNWQ